MRGKYRPAYVRKETKQLLRQNSFELLIGAVFLSFADLHFHGN